MHRFLMVSPRFTALMIASVLTTHIPDAAAYSRSELKRFQSGIVDYRRKINPGFKKVKRQQTRHIVVHTSELGLSATLRVVSKGKRFKSGRTTPGGHAHYVIARNGKTYRMLDHRYRADHAGLSMWNKTGDLSKVSVGIELVGYHNAAISSAQYRAVGPLIRILQRVYGMSDRAVLTHSQVAYGRPNPWFRKNHRGRKRCAKNFNRSKAGLLSSWPYDPDVRAGRLMADPTLANLFYPQKNQALPVDPQRVQAIGSNIISKQNSAWSIAGEDYNAPGTAYILPDGRTLPGNKLGKKIGWSRLPAGTKVLLNQEREIFKVRAKNPLKTISGSTTAWSHAGPGFRRDTTIYFLPSGRILPGSKIPDWDDLPVGTRLVVGYDGPFEMTKERTAYKIAGLKYRHRSVIYHLPGGRILPGDQIKDFSNLPKGVRLFLPRSIGDNDPGK